MYFDRAYIKEMAKKQLQYMGSGAAIGVAFLMVLLGGGSSGSSLRINVSTEGGALMLPGGTKISAEEFSNTLFVILPLLLITAIAALLYSFLLGNVIAAGGRGWFLRYHRGEPVRVGEMFASFRIYKPVLATTALRALYCFLWGIFTCGIGAVVMQYAYSMADYIIYENPNLTASQALRMSKAMTDGHKWNLFVFELSFLGWEILSGFTCGILGIVYVAPYHNMAHAGIYEELKDQGIRGNKFTWADFGQFPPPAAPPAYGGFGIG